MHVSSVLVLAQAILLLLLPALTSSVAVVAAVHHEGDARSNFDDILHLEPDLGHDSRGDDGGIQQVNQKYVNRILHSQWEKHRRWHVIAKREKRTQWAGNIVKLTAVSALAMVRASASQLPESHKWKATMTMISGVSGLCIAGYTTIVNKFFNEEKIQEMANTFLTSQALKAEFFKFRAGGKPYDKFQTNMENALNLFKERCNSLSDSVNNSKFCTTMPDNEPMPGPIDDMDSYMDNRIDREISHYVKRAKSMSRRGAFCRHCEIALHTMASSDIVKALPAVSAQYFDRIPASVQKVATGFGGFTGTFGVAFPAIAVAFAAHSANEHFVVIAQVYQQAVEELRKIKDDWPSTALRVGSPDWEDQVTKTEDIIQSTYETWAKVKVTPDKGETSGGPEEKKKLSEMNWNPNIVCGTDESGAYPAGDRMEWLMDNMQMNKEDAQNKVMMEFPYNF
mmetsp:Transcript_866/g.1865  ORF Transcript_866/g.1865 Transcript_866/m.1865 type:complete len:452 (-) Transcript_866:244-1599(-)